MVNTEESEVVNDFDKYQAFTDSVRRYPQQVALEYLFLGLAGEVGEAANIRKKILRDRPTPEKEEEMINRILEELGDALWYIAQLCSQLDYDFSQLVVDNMSKLTARYGSTAPKFDYDLPPESSS